MKILVTGTSGFIAKHLIDALSDDHDLYGLSRNARPNKKLVKTFSWSDLKKLPTLDICIHTAGLAHDLSGRFNDRDYVNQNFNLTRELLFHLKDKCNSLIYFSSIKAICDQNCTDLKERSSYNPGSPYGISKQMAEEYIIQNAEDLGFKYFIFRPVMVYGKGSKGNLNNLIKLVRRGIPYPFKNHDNKKSILYIKNLTHIVQHFVEHDIEQGIYHLADKEQLSSVQIVNLINESLSRKGRSFSFPGLIYKRAIRGRNKFSRALKKLLSNLSVDNSKLLNALGDNPLPYTSEEAFKDFLSK